MPPLIRNQKIPRKIITLVIAFVTCTLTHADSGIDAGKAVYKKANCVGCHKWHGGGGGGYGGVALSLRQTPLDRENIMLIVRCGRPGTGMPYHHRKAYRGDNRDCYDQTKEDLGDQMPPRARHFLREKELEAVTDYVIEQLQGKGSPDYADCVAFWGADAKRCRLMAAESETIEVNPNVEAKE